MATATLSSKGQLVIPKSIRERLHLHAGDTIDLLVQESGDVLLRPAVEDVRKLRGMLWRPGRKPVALAAMKRAIRQRAGVRP